MSNKRIPGKEAVTGRWILKGRLHLTSPLIIGGGSTLFGDSDIVVLKDGNGKPYIPSSSITGALRHAFNDYEYTGDNPGYKQNSLWFWGGEYPCHENGHKSEQDKEQENDGANQNTCTCQSAIIISDLSLEGDNYNPVAIRDGIKVNCKSGTVEEGKKFDFETVEPGNFFDFKAEVVIRQVFSEPIFELLFNWVVSLLQSGEFALGARTSKGFGQCRLKDINVFKFNFSQKDHVIGWLSGDYEAALKKEAFTPPEQFKYKYDLFRIKALFRVSNSIIIGSYPSVSEEPDKVHIKSRKSDGSGIPVAVIPGTSLQGAVRSRAERIAKTLRVYNEQKFNNLFGWVEEDSNSGSGGNAAKSRIIIKESQVDGAYDEQTQYRIRIDRFTGGVMDNSLFDSMPIWAKDSSGPFITMDLVIKGYKAWEAGLMLLVLKDMWNEDLPVGGEKAVGRGTLRGVRAEISISDWKITFEKLDNGKLRLYENEPEDWNEAAAEELERLVSAFIHINEIGGVKHVK